MNKLKKWSIPLGILVVTAIVANVILDNPPQSRRGGPPNAPQLTVDVDIVRPQAFTVIVESYGSVQPSIQSALVAQVSGQITYVSPHFKNGGFFNEGDVLLKVDPRDYQANVKIAEAGLLTAQQNLLEEQANAKQAKIDWERLGNGEQASDLVLRKPQLEAAKAGLLSAQANLTRAELALERTQVTAPFTGRVLEQLVDFGQVLANNTKVAQIYSTNSVEIRLPINNKDMPLMRFIEEQTDLSSSPIGARFTSGLDKNQSWLGQIIRTEAAIDAQSQQLYVVGQISHPYDTQQHPGAQIKIGQYVSAEIEGKTLNDAIVIKNSAIYQGSYVFVVENKLLKRREITLKWQNKHVAIIETGLEAGEKLVTTPLGQVSSGTPVIISGEKRGQSSFSQAQFSPSQSSSAEREQRLKQAAERMGITVEELKARRKSANQPAGSNRANQGKANDE